MSSSVPRLQFKSLRRSASPLEYELYRAGLEWDLTEPIVIEDRRDIRSERQWHEKVQPYHHQVTNLMTFCRRLPVTLLADDVGLGKTISAGLIASELISRGRVSKILVVCPKLLMPQWAEELDVKFGIPSTQATGSDLIGAKVPGEVGAVITTYNSARLHFDAIARAGFEMLVLDEAHKLRNLYGVENPPQVARRFRQALADRLFKYVLMLTATPIQNRLWDLYSLVDLLTVARGHENPFGTQGMFARRFIADGPTKARQLKPDKRDEFRSIVYGYMSRVRHADANLHFPNRKVQLHKVDPTPEEIELIKLIALPIQKLNRLAQTSIAQALISSPHALAAQLENMASKRTIPPSLAREVRSIVDRMGITAKLQGLRSLVEELRVEQPEGWRMVVFTGRRETQTTIEAFLERDGIKCGLINGDSGSRNQQTISRFKKTPPDVHVIVSTEAGSEGINLQAANVLVNYDLPWNPMIVEQRIGRIQRLASEHATVCIFNVILKGTFEEYVVGRLMEKLQLASHAIGDVEALLEAAGLDEEGEGESGGFAEKIRELVVASLAGKNVEEATRLAEKSISEAKVELNREEKSINAMLGGMDGAIDLGPRCPKLPLPVRSMDARRFAISALENLGATVSRQQSNLYESSNMYVVELDGRREHIRFDNTETAPEDVGTLCRPGTAIFERIVNRITGKALHWVEDLDQAPMVRVQEVIKNWVNGFGGVFNSVKMEEITLCFTGAVLLRVRVTVTHDSYERLVEISCSSEGQKTMHEAALEPISQTIEDPTIIGLPVEQLKSKAMEDVGVVEFCRFYSERMVEEIKATGDDARKRKKLEDDFTPRIEISLVGIQGTVHRQIKLRVAYAIGAEANYESLLTLIPSTTQIISQPEMGACSATGVVVPRDCLAQCNITGTVALQHKLKRSEISGRMALPEHIVKCAVSGRQVLSDEVEKSAVTGRLVAKAILKTSALSGKMAEPNFFTKCEFSSSEVLDSELSVSQVSGRRYRNDEQLCSAVSGKVGHRSEFIICPETNQSLLPTEAEKCEVTGKSVMPGLLELCEVTGKKVLPAELEKCAATGKKALKRFFVSSSLSSARLIEQEAVRSMTGKYCLPVEARRCLWSGRQCHPDDLRICELTGISMHSENMGMNGGSRFKVLVNLLNGNQGKVDRPELWDAITARASSVIGSGRFKVESAELSTDGRYLAVCLSVRTLMGFKIRQAGLIYSIQDGAVAGRVILGKRTGDQWKEENSLSVVQQKSL